MNSKFILLVEDNPDDEVLIVRALRKNQIWNDVEVVRDGVAALDFLFATGPCCGRDTADLPALVLLDLRLPRMHGFQVLRRIRADRRTQDLPVIIITASWEVEDILNGYSLRAILRIIVQSNTYQLSSRYAPGTWNESWRPYYARHYPRRLMAEEVLDAIFRATNLDAAITVNNIGVVRKAMQLPDTMLKSHRWS